jgi:hypothetical protein
MAILLLGAVSRYPPLCAKYSDKERSFIGRPYLSTAISHMRILLEEGGALTEDRYNGLVGGGLGKRHSPCPLSFKG